jgi:hypothetical protein
LNRLATMANFIPWATIFPSVMFFIIPSLSLFLFWTLDPVP